ncbi:3-hydroxyacyl-CoA dehydrogenase family protein [Streptomyces sp. NPDC053474]|uniref:3-hydroxyacyl-CoA dehydrogenase family protein n=1 Tax=Streptomyces sp. NPDC053474 TaxID=3365704 RepID=UPI0037D26040
MDIAEHALESARAGIDTNVRLAPLIRPGTKPVPPQEVTGRIRFTTDLKQLRGADYVFEMVIEDWAVKRPLYGELDTLCRSEVPFGVNTSAIPITRVASVTGRPDRVIGTHFMNPAPLKPTVEVIRGHHTSDVTWRARGRC